MDKMKIAFLNGDISRTGGTERMTMILANEFNKKDKVYIISIKKESEIFYQINSGIEIVVLSELVKKENLVTEIRTLKKYLTNKKIDWLINVDIGSSMYGIPATIGLKTKVITWEHSNYFNNWNSKVFPYIRKMAARFSDELVVLTEKDKQNYVKNIRHIKAISVIPNPIIKQKFKYDINSKIILSCGMLSDIKGFDKAILLASKILKKYPDWKWIICGDGPQKNYLEKLILKYDLTNKVILKGNVADMNEIYKQASFFIMTSKFEGLPMVLLEAKTWGLPLLSFDIMTGPSEIIQNGVNGYLIPAYNMELFRKKIERLITDKELRMSFSNKSQIDMDKFELNNIMNKWYHVLGKYV